MGLEPAGPPERDGLKEGLQATALGVVAGLRSIMPMALLASHLAGERSASADSGWVLRLLASPGAARSLQLAALGEVVVDKLPGVPSRLDPLPLGFRVGLGASAAALQALAERRPSERGAMAGALGALLGSLVGFWLRTNLPLPPLLLALAEDALAFTLGRWAFTA